MKIAFVFLLFLTCCVSEKPQSDQDSTYKFMQQGFQDPPAKAKPIVYHWWLGGNVDTLRIKEELISMKNAGISGFSIFEIGSRDTVLVKPGPAFLSEKSLEVIKFAVEEAGQLGLEAGLNTASSWNAGGNWITPDHAAKSIYYSKLAIKGGTETVTKLPFPEIPQNDPWGKPRLIKFKPDGKPVFYKEIAVLAVPANYENAAMDTSKILNLSDFYNPETEILSWEALAGDWEIQRYICSNSGENLILPSLHSGGPIVDHYDAAATEFHFLYIINRLESVLGDLRNTALKSLYMASYEAKGFTWTTTLPEVFKEINGYAVDKFLPALFNDGILTPELKANFKADFQRTLSELMINNFYKKSKEICNKYGLKNNCEAGGPGLPLHNVPVEPIKALGGGLDIPRGEFWINHGRFNDKGIDIIRVVKEVSSASHIYNRGIVEMEAFTTFQHWQEGPFEMKPYGDRAFCEGMNKVVVHGSTHNPMGTGVPGIVYHAGTHYNDKRVWWPKVKPFNEYLARISFILQEADFKADILYYYGDTIPNYGGHKNSRFSPGPGYDYEIINTEILLQLNVKNKKLILPENGAQFNLLVLTAEYEMRPEVLLKLKELVDHGAVIMGPKPVNVPSRRIEPGMPELEGLIDELWTDYNSGSAKKRKASIQYGAEPSHMLASLDIPPDFSYADKELYTLDYTHYAKGDLDFYFIRNTTDSWLSRDISFRQQDKVPEIWDPVSGEIIAVTIYNQNDKYINIPVTLAPYESIFVVFKRGSQNPQFTHLLNNNLHPPLLSFTRDGICFWENRVIEIHKKGKSETVNNLVKEQILDGVWRVFFPKGHGAPENAVFPKLLSWTESENKGIKYFSGIARYEQSFVYDINSSSIENQRIYLDLGDLSHLGEVWLNDQPLGITWAKPYRFDITETLKAGPNNLVIEIANTWSNRLTGDAITGDKYTSTNITSTDIEKGYFIRLPWAEVPLIRSGLFGPVKLINIKPLK